MAGFELNSSSEPLLFIMELTEEKPRLRIPIKGDTFSIGRVTSNDLCLAGDQTVSRHHCTVELGKENFRLRDLGSRNGTYLNGNRVQGETTLPIPSLLIVGRSRLAVVPTTLKEEDITTIVEATYSSRGSILIPSTTALEKREAAFLVVDLVGSSQLIQKNDIYLAKIVSALGQILDRQLRKEIEPFLQCTGDGFFASFSSADSAQDSAINLGPKLKSHFSIPLKLSIALHWGFSYFTGEGSRTGKDVYAVFALEDLRHKDKSLERKFKSQQLDILLLMTEAFWSQLMPEHQAEARPLGSYLLKGLDRKVKIFHI